MTPNPDAGLVTVPSAHGVAETVRRLEAALADRKIHVFARIDHADGAHRVHLELWPTVVVIFGNPQAGTPLMQSSQTIGLDLPLKTLVWEDAAGKVWLTYNRPDFLAARHGVKDREPTVQAMTAGLEALARAATAP